MRQLKPEVVESRKKNLLQWVIHYYIKNSRPVSSSLIADEAGMGLSPATIRNILQELEDEGFLHQPHTSAGREPTDKGYRFFVDYLIDVQRLASDDKERIERQYRDRVDELDTLLSETSKLLSKVSQGAGLVLSQQMRDQTLRRLELIPLTGKNVLGILVTEAGLVRHWPIRLNFAPTARQINVLNRFLNDTICGCTVKDAQSMVMSHLRKMEAEFQELTNLADELLKEVGRVITPESLYVEGTDNILSYAEDIGDVAMVQALMRVFNEKRRLAGLLEHELGRKFEGGKLSLAKPKPHVSIGVESGLPELKDLSLVTTTYKYNDRVVGVLGILGSKRMEYSRMMSLVDYMGDIVSRQLCGWEQEDRGHE
ncbi:MAG TPA: heat-inducible transcription repressor HrcA [Elusimicrobia bacterium]|nr:heat-inducible transcription repressor HrcA [Elusimicrobiota bacterium]HBT61476.1 heat-inducible transcription repressor HrcA [Elusimicrobiota bacterium]